MLANKPLAQVSAPDYDAGATISGQANAAMPYGLMVCYENDTNPENERKIVPATGKRGWFLENTVLAVADWNTNVLSNALGNTINTPVPVGEYASARDFRTLEVEGSVHVDTAELDAATPVDTPLTLTSGKWTPCTTTGQKICGVLERKLTPVIAANTTRFSIRRADGVFP